MTRLAPSEISVTLPSNSSTEIFKTNRPNSYKTIVKRTINEETDGQWEVAPISITYPHSFDNLDHPIKVGLLIAFPHTISDLYPLEENQHMKKAIRISGEYMQTFRSRISSEELALFDSVLKDYKSKLTGNCEQPFFADIFQIPAGYYANVQEILDQIELGFEKALGIILRIKFGHTFEGKLKLKYEASSRRVSLNADGMQGYFFTQDQELFVNILGLPENWQYGNASYPFFGADFPVANCNTCKFVNLHSIYVYSDIINYQLVGDTEAPLFGTVPIQGSREEVITYVFNPTYYYPVARANINEIEIELYTENGDPFPFTSTSKVVLRLHFRKKTWGGGGGGAGSFDI